MRLKDIATSKTSGATYAEEIERVPKEEVEDVIKSFRLDGAINVETRQAEDGSWTVTAAFEATELTT